MIQTLTSPGGLCLHAAVQAKKVLITICALFSSRVISGDEEESYYRDKKFYSLGVEKNVRRTKLTAQLCVSIAETKREKANSGVK